MSEGIRSFTKDTKALGAGKTVVSHHDSFLEKEKGELSLLKRDRGGNNRGGFIVEVTEFFVNELSRRHHNPPHALNHSKSECYFHEFNN